MYKFDYYTEKDQQKVIDFMKENTFALITGIGENRPVATQIPLTIKIKGDNIFLEGHMMRKTDHHLAFEKNNHVLVLFTGPHCFVNANWYTDPHMGSTWNYMTVHAKGNIVFTDDTGTYAAIKAVTNKYEGTTTAAAFDAMSKEYIDQMLKAIIGFTIEVEKLDNVFKLSQNKSEAEQINIIKQLKKTADGNSRDVAHEMEKRIGTNKV